MGLLYPALLLTLSIAEMLNDNKILYIHFRVQWSNENVPFGVVHKVRNDLGSKNLSTRHGTQGQLIH